MLKEYSAQAFRLFVLLSHYSSAIDFSPDALKQAQRSLERLQKAARIITESIENEDDEDRALGTINDGDPAVAAARAQFLEHMDNDFNTPYALRTLFDLIRDINRRINDAKISQKGLKEARELLLQAGEVLGLSFFSPAVMAGEKAEVDIATKLEETLIWTRQRLREKKDWQIADEIRTRMKELGIAVEDT
jgi:cysteinyl-tRNA synthetase